jgi:hypothetical protein
VGGGAPPPPHPPNPNPFFKLKLINKLIFKQFIFKNLLNLYNYSLGDNSFPSIKIDNAHTLG